MSSPTNHATSKKQDKLRQAKQRIDQNIQKHGSLEAWLDWERQHNPNFREKTYTLQPLD